MRKPLRIQKTWLIALAITIVALGTVVSVLVFATGDSRLTVKGYSDVVRFEAADVATLQVQIYDLSGKEVWDSGMVAGGTVDWDRRNESGERMAYGAYLYVAQGWEAGGGLSFKKNGKLALMPGDKVQLQEAPTVPSTTDTSSQTSTTQEEPRYAPMAYSHTGDFTVSGNLGIGTDTPDNPISVVYTGDQEGIRMLNSGYFNVGPNLADSNVKMYSLFSDSAAWDYLIGLSGGSRGHGQLIFVTGLSGLPQSRMVVTKHGNVGIGTTSPSARLEVQATSEDLIAAYNSTNRVFVVKNTGEVRADGAVYAADFNTGSADVAERINVSEWVEAGDVVEIDPEHAGFFRKSASPYSTKVAGIISTSPGVILGNSFDDATDEWEDNRPVLAVTGRVPCKVSTENGSIAIGDLLVASSIPGVAMKGNPEQATGAVVGKAMESLKEGTGEIMAQVTLR